MTSATSPTVTVIIPVRDDVAGVERCLAALERQTYPRDRYQVVVVDNGSTPPLGAALADHPEVRLLQEPREGSYAARNAGIAHTSGDVVAFTDADCIPSPGWLRAGVAALQGDPRVGAVAGRIEVFARDPARPTAVEAYELVHAFPQRRYAEQQHFGATANLITWRRVLRCVGPFDATLRSGGDREWGARAHAAGYDVVYAHDACVRHPARATIRELRAKFVRVHRGDRVLASRGLASRRTSWRAWGPPIGAVLRVWRGDALPDRRSRLAYARGAFVARYLGLWARSTAHRSRRTHAVVAASAQSPSS